MTQLLTVLTTLAEQEARAIPSPRGTHALQVSTATKMTQLLPSPSLTLMVAICANPESSVSQELVLVIRLFRRAMQASTAPSTWPLPIQTTVMLATTALLLESKPLLHPSKISRLLIQIVHTWVQLKHTLTSSTIVQL